MLAENERWEEEDRKIKVETTKILLPAAWITVLLLYATERASCAMSPEHAQLISTIY